jgi:hypothetical protein
MKSVALVLSLIMLTGCASFGAPAPAEVVTGKTIEALMTTYLDTGALYDDLYRERVISEAEYQQWREFATQAKPILLSAHAAWKTAVLSNKPMDPMASANLLAMKRQLLILAAKLAKKGA